MQGKWKGIEQISGIVFLTFTAVGCVVVLRPFMSAILWAAILCYVTWPLYKHIERWLNGRKNLAAGVMTALIAMVLVLPFALVGMTFADSVTLVVQRMQDYRSHGLPSEPEWILRLPIIGNHLHGYWTDLQGNAVLVAKTLGHWSNRMAPMVLRWSLSLGQGIAQLVLSMLIAFFFYRDGVWVAARLGEGIKRIAGDYSHRLLETVGGTVKSVVYGLFGTAMAQGIMGGVGFLIADVPAPFLLGLLTFLLSVVPLGPPLVWVPVTVSLLAEGRTGMGIFMGVWGLVGISGIDNVVRPVLISRGKTLPFALSLLGVMGGLLAFGFIGVFLGPTLLAAGYSIVQEFLKKPPDVLARG